jgi:hypothetical protein
MPGFWQPGHRIVSKELDKQEQSLLAPLKDRLKQVSDPIEKAALKEQIRNIKAEYRGKRRDAKYSLFANT